MDYNLLHKKRKLIFEQFLYNKTMTFSELEKATGIRSNELAYFLDKLEKEDVINKNNSTYTLSKGAETYIPFFVDNKDRLSPLPVILVQCIKENKVLLFKREKRPYKNFWSLPGGRIKLDESISDAAERIIKEKTFLNSKFDKVNAVLHERAKDKDANTVHAYILIFVSVEATSDVSDKECVRWFPIEDLPEDMIPSDKHLVQNNGNDFYNLKEEVIIMGADEEKDTLDMEFLKTRNK